MDFVKYTDIIVAKFQDGKPRNVYSSITFHIPELAEKHKQSILVDYLEQNDLLQADNESVYRITTKGFRIAADGGWARYLEHEQAEKSVDQRIKELTIKDLEGSIFQIKYWWLLTIISGVIGGVVTVIAQIILKEMNAL